MQFHPTGLVAVLAILLPNLLQALLPARGKPAGEPKVPAVFAVLERVGQVACLALPLITGVAQPFAFNGFTVGLLLCRAVYYAGWARYYLGGRVFALLFRPLWGVPLPMAWAPALFFFLWGLWTASWPLVLASAIFAVGHLAESRAVAQLLK